MNTSIVTLLILFAASTLLPAQNTPVETGNIPVAQSAGGGQYGTLYANLINKKKNDYHSTIGSPYLNEEWAPAEIEVLGKTTVFDEVRIDVINQYLEVKVNGLEKILDLKYIHSLDLYPDSTATMHFVNGSIYTFEGKQLTGFIRKIKTGNFIVLERFKARIVKPDMNDKIVGADPRDKFVHSSEIYVLRNDRLHLIRNKKDLLELMSDKEKVMKTYLRQNNISVRDAAETAQALEYYQQGD